VSAVAVELIFDGVDGDEDVVVIRDLPRRLETSSPAREEDTSIARTRTRDLSPT
jgi:hypothetical protein